MLILFKVNFENSLEIVEKTEKCEINFVVFLLIRFVLWCDEFEMFPNVFKFKNRISL